MYSKVINLITKSMLRKDTFHEVKSKREKKKELKDTTDIRPRGSSSNRGARSGPDRYAGRSGSTHFGSSGQVHMQPRQHQHRELHHLIQGDLLYVKALQFRNRNGSGGMNDWEHVMVSILLEKIYWHDYSGL
ncbi:uncharacterized protein [Rutidosis leptorrhynchoides]|uniref:uncharacterized protein isoform X1 n=1 Tax=Rutidosis leptorrhynchoides TaxID=125765 RepID=UPI003A99B180